MNDHPEPCHSFIKVRTCILLCSEKCNEKSVKQLQEEIAAKGIKVSCKDDPR